MAKNELPFNGEKLKYRIVLQSDGFNMDRDNFTITLYRGEETRTFQKSELVTKQSNSGYKYYLCFDSTLFGPGPVFIEINAHVPDTDFPGGIRLEKSKFLLTEILP